MNMINKLLISLAILFSFSNCTNEYNYGNNKNAVKTVRFENVTQTGATVYGDVITDNGSTIIEKGICFGISNNPSINGTKIVFDTSSLGLYACTLVNLLPNKIYYARAYASNNYGTAYGSSIEFRTLPATVPIISTTSVNNITATTSISGGVISSDGASAVTSRGVCYSNTTSNPTIANTRTSNGTGTGAFTSQLNGLNANTLYYVNAYATNSIGTVYGTVKTFTTLPATPPIGVITSQISNITQTNAIGGGNVTSDGGASITSRGVCWSSSNSSPTIANSRTLDGSGIGNYTSNISGLTAGTTYYVRAYATNAVGTSYGSAVSFTTNPYTLASGITTNTVTSVLQNSAISGGNISLDGGTAITARGVCWSSTSSSPTISNPKTVDGIGIGSFVSNISGLLPNTTYYVRAYATNSVGTAYGNFKTFITSNATLPSGITTTSITNVSYNNATSGGTVLNDGGSLITSRGVCWSSTTSSPTTANTKTVDGSGTGTFTSSITGLLSGTTYYVRAYAVNSIGTVYGTVKTFTTTFATVPTGIVTTSVNSITQTTASSGGTISSDGASPITSRGVCWSSTITNPTINNTRTNDGTGIGSYTSSITGLQSGVTYYVRAYATNGVGTSYGAVRTFTTTIATVPTGIVTTSVNSITQTTASSGGTISSDGGSPITSKGICWSSTTASPTISNNATNNGTGISSFTSSISGLSTNTTYYVRAYAINNTGVAYGNTVSFVTPPNLSVGQSYQGGVIAYILVPGDTGYVSGQNHGIIATATNQALGLAWGCSGTNVSGTVVSIGSGQNNTTLIVNTCSSTSTAAYNCNALTSGGYSDWYLPSYNELQKMYLNNIAIGGFISTSYWSSTQNNSTTAYAINFGTGAGTSTNSKASLYYVRAIRKF